MTYADGLPIRTRVLVLGGGIHGVGVLHDFASRGWRDVHLVEKGALGGGTSSKSTKLIHGGLRYLKRLSDFGLVSEGLRERQLLMRLAPDLVRPVELLFPILKGGGMPKFLVKAGLGLYDVLAGRYRLEPHRTLNQNEVEEKAPMLDLNLCRTVYSFWDGQTDDLGLVFRVAASARRLGAGITEGCRIIRLAPNDDGWMATVLDQKGQERQIGARYVINCLGPWANRLLEASAIPPTHKGVNNKGVHLLFEDFGLKSGLFLQSLRGDGRIFFMLPWQGHTLLGTTEDLFTGDPDRLTVETAEVTYLLENCNAFLKRKLSAREVCGSFAGLRWLAVENGHGLSDTSRHHIIGERSGKRGLLMTLYGGKLTTYRNLSRTIGDRVTSHFGEFRESRTHEGEAWASPAETPLVADVTRRFSAVS